MHWAWTQSTNLRQFPVSSACPPALGSQVHLAFTSFHYLSNLSQLPSASYTCAAWPGVRRRGSNTARLGLLPVGFGQVASMFGFHFRGR